VNRTEGAGLGVALIGHVALFGLLSVGFLATPNPMKLKPQPIEVTLAEQVALESTAPVVSSEEQKIDYAPEPTPGAPQPAPAEPEPEPEVAKPNPAPPKPAPAPKPDAKPQPPVKPQPTAKPQPPSKPVKAPTNPNSKPQPDRKPNLDLDSVIKDIRGGGPKPNDAKNPNPPAAVMSTAAAANIGSAIQRQVQPCADRQVSPGPGTERIWAVVRLQLNRDGSLAAPPRIVGHKGVDDDNERYVARVDDAVRAVFAGCSPLRGLPLELYDVQNGWKSFTMNYRIKS